MKIDIQTVGFDADNELLDFLDDRLKHLSKYSSAMTGVDVYLKSKPNAEAETKSAEIKVYMPGESLYADHQADSFRESIIESVDKLKRQIKKYKEKHYSKR